MKRLSTCLLLVLMSVTLFGQDWQGEAKYPGPARAFFKGEDDAFATCTLKSKREALIFEGLIRDDSLQVGDNPLKGDRVEFWLCSQRYPTSWFENEGALYGFAKNPDQQARLLDRKADFLKLWNQSQSSKLKTSQLRVERELGNSLHLALIPGLDTLFVLDTDQYTQLPPDEAALGSATVLWTRVGADWKFSLTLPAKALTYIPGGVLEQLWLQFDYCDQDALDEPLSILSSTPVYRWGDSRDYIKVRLSNSLQIQAAPSGYPAFPLGFYYFNEKWTPYLRMLNPLAGGQLLRSQLKTVSSSFTVDSLGQQEVSLASYGLELPGKKALALTSFIFAQETYQHVSVKPHAALPLDKRWKRDRQIIKDANHEWMVLINRGLANLDEPTSYCEECTEIQIFYRSDEKKFDRTHRLLRKQKGKWLIDERDKIIDEIVNISAKDGKLLLELSKGEFLLGK